MLGSAYPADRPGGGDDGVRCHTFSCRPAFALKYSDQPVLNYAVLVCFPLSHALDPFFARILSGMVQEFERERFALVLYTPVQNMLNGQDHSPFPVLLTRGDIDGAVLISGTGGLPEMIARLRREPFFSDRPILSLLEPHAGCSAVLVDYRAGSYAAMAHLLAMGHRRVGYFAIGDYILEQRVEGMRQACQDFTPHEPVALITLPWGEDAREQEAIWPEAVAQAGCSAVLACNDQTACELASYLQHAGWRIPEQLGIVGFDDTHTLPDTQGQNQLTTVHSPLEEVGRRGAQPLLQRMTRQIAYDPVEIVPTHLVVRGSTAPVAGR